MRQVLIKLADVPTMNLNWFMFEIKDDVTLRAIENVLIKSQPGITRIIKWADPDETRLPMAFDAIVEFSDDMEMMEWMMRWA